MALASVQMIIQALQKIIAFAMYDLKPSYLHNDSVVFCVNISDMRQYVKPDGENGPVFETESIVICVATVGKPFFKCFHDHFQLYQLLLYACICLNVV